MGLFDFLKSKKKKEEPAPTAETEVPVSLDDVDLSGIEPPETRYTQEYQDFLATLDGAVKSEAPSGEEESTDRIGYNPCGQSDE